MLINSKHKKIISGTVIVALIATTLPLSAVAGDWVNDWLKSATSSNGGTYKNQQRGFFMGGSYSLHAPAAKTDSFVTVQAPSITAGCGGIDFFSGSLGFMSVDKLVEKLQKILQNAPGVAFQMALETLCSKCAQIMSSMEAIANALNGMNMNDCQAAKGLMTAAVSGATKAYNSITEDTANNAASNGAMTTGGVNELIKQSGSVYDSMKTLGTTAMDQINTWGDKLKKPGADAGKSLGVSSCTGPINEFIPNKNEAISILLKANANGGSMTPSHIDMLRGLIGDIAIREEGGAIRPVFYPGCMDNKVGTWKTTGDIYKKEFGAKDPDQLCSAEAVKNSIKTDVAARLLKITAGLGDKTKAIDSADMQFIGKLPLPIVGALRTATAMGGDVEMIDSIADVVADMHIIMAVQSGVENARRLGLDVDNLIKKSAAGKKDGCNLDLLSDKMDGYPAEFASFKEDADAFLKVMGDDFQNEIIRLESQLKVADYYQQAENVVRKYAANTFSPSALDRVMALSKGGKK